MSIKGVINSILKIVQRKNVVYANFTLADKGNLMSNKIVLVSGGGSGFGLAIAKRFVACGAKVIITGRNEEKLKKVLLEIGSKNIQYLVWDLCDYSNAKTKLSEVNSIFGPIDIAVNNAGVWTSKKWYDIDELEWDRIMNTNIKGLFFLCQAEALEMNSNAKVKKIINITSIEGNRGGFGPYYASKWGANGITKGLAKELIKNNVIVNAIAPGMGITDINPNLPKDGNLALDYNLNGRYVTVEEIAETAVFLASDSANSIVGQVVVVDGGMSLL